MDQEWDDYRDGPPPRHWSECPHEVAILALVLGGIFTLSVLPFLALVFR
jgi:hypothetical protein